MDKLIYCTSKTDINGRRGFSFIFLFFEKFSFFSSSLVKGDNDNSCPCYVPHTCNVVLVFILLEKAHVNV